MYRRKKSFALMKKRILFLLLVAVLTLSFVSCARHADEPATLPGSEFGVEPPSEEYVPADATAEGVIMTCSKEVVPADFNTIYFLISRADGSDEDFYFHSSKICLERWEKDGWEPISYLKLENDVFIISQPTKWWLSQRGKSSMTIERQYITEEIIPGRYRAVAFVGSEPTALCAYFDIAE